MRRVAIIGCLVVASLAATMNPAPAHDQMQYWKTMPPSSDHLESGACSASAQIVLQELGRSGVNRLRAQWQLRGPNDIDGVFPTYAKTGWAYSTRFPNDDTSYYQRFGIVPGVINFASNTTFALWVKMVGERPSLWQRDLVLKGNLGAVGCGFFASP